MSVSFVRSWYSRIPGVERDLPVLLHNGKVYTPREVYNEVMRGSALGRELQEKLERVHAGYSFALDDLKGLDYIARKRVEKIIENLPPGFSIVSIVNGERRVYRKEEIIGSPIYEKMVEKEKRKIIEILRG